MTNLGDIIVQKYGGSSVATPERILKVAERVLEQARLGRKIALVVSAMGDTTDELINLMNKVNAEPSARELDQLLATGEIVSVSLMASAIQKLGGKARSYIATNLGIKTNNNYGSAEILSFEKISELIAFVRSGGIPVVAGYQGQTEAGDFTTLGRGGSDITAVALAKALNQKLCEKYTDEDGIYTADPRIIPTAKKVWHLNYDEMEMLAKYGNKILHPRAISYAREANIRIHVRSSFTKHEGSIVGPIGDPNISIKSLALDKKQAVLIIDGLYDNYTNLGEHLIKKYFPDANINFNCVNNFFSNGKFLKYLNFIPTSWEWRKNSDNTGSLRVSFCILDSFNALPSLWELAANFRASETKFVNKVVMISLVGCGIKENKNIVLHINKLISENQIIPILTDYKDIRYTIIVHTDQSLKAIDILHNFIISQNKVT